MTFKVGDVVRLKSGGPRMTVSGIRHGQDGVLTCEFFVGNELGQLEFDEPMLAHVWPEVTCDQDESYGLYDADVAEAQGEYEAIYCGEPIELSDEELDALMYISEAQQYGEPV